MRPEVKRKLEKLSNDQWAGIIFALIIVSIILFMIDPIADFLLVVIVFGVTARISYELAKLIDYFDDNVHSRVEMTGLYHLAYALEISILAGIVVGHIGARVCPFSPAWYAVMTPTAAYFICGFVMAGIGYAIAWRTIPNRKKER